MFLIALVALGSSHYKRSTETLSAMLDVLQQKKSYFENEKQKILKTYNQWGDTSRVDMELMELEDTIETYLMAINQVKAEYAEYLFNLAEQEVLEKKSK